MLHFKKHGKGLKSTLVLQWIICAALWSLSIAAVQAAGALWQNPYTGRVISLPVGVHVGWSGIHGDIIEFGDFKTDISMELTKSGDGSEYGEESSNNTEAFKLTPYGYLNGYPISVDEDNIKRQCNFFIQVDQLLWKVRLVKCDQSEKYSQLRALFDVILPSMIPLKSDESFELTIPWSAQKIKLNQFSQNTHNWNAYATSALLNPDQRMFHGFFLKTSKESKNYDGLVNIRGENIDIIVAGRQVTPENLEQQLTTSTLKTDNGGSIIAYKKENIGGHTVLKGQYIDEMVGGTKQETHYLIPLKNRIWTVVSSVYDDDQGKYPNTSQRINIIEHIIATLPDNPPDIVTTYTNPQTKNQLRLPKNWAVVQDFPDGRPRDIGIVELDKAENASSISVYCGRQLVPVLDYVIRSDDYKKARFANCDVVVHDDGVFYLYTKDKAGACNLAITNYDKEKDNDKLAIAEKLFAKENP